MQRIIHIFVLLVIVQTLSVGQITMKGGDISLPLTTGTIDGLMVEVVNSANSISVAKQDVVIKVTVITSCPGQKFGLRVLAVGPSKGTAAPEITLVNGNPALDFITGIAVKPAKPTTCTLQYTASASFSQGNSIELGDDVHTVTYTVQAQ